MNCIQEAAIMLNCFPVSIKFLLANSFVATTMGSGFSNLRKKSHKKHGQLQKKQKVIYIKNTTTWLYSKPGKWKTCFNIENARDDVTFIVAFQFSNISKSFLIRMFDSTGKDRNIFILHRSPYKISTKRDSN